MKFFLWSSSLNGESCQQYQPSRKSSSTNDDLCQSCQCPPLHHKLDMLSPLSSAISFKSLNDLTPLLKAFCVVRNARMCLTSLYSLPGDIEKELKDALFTLEHLKPPHSHHTNGKTKSFLANVCNSELLEEAAKLRQLLPYRSSSDIMSLVAQCDVFYYRLHYNLELAGRGAQVSATAPLPSLPQPHIYFSEYASDVLLLNKQMKTYIDKNFSSSFKMKLSNMFSFLDEKNPPFTHNPLLLLHFSRWRESVCLLNQISHISSDTSLLEAACRSSGSKGSEEGQGRRHASMKRPGDPLLPSLTREWNDASRVWACHLYAYATPSPAALDMLFKYSPLVEIGAGTGYWAHCLRLRHPSVVVHAYDKDPPCSASTHKSNSYHGRASAWTSVYKGGVENISHHLEKSRNTSTDTGALKAATLFLCYPPPDSDMALQALRNFTGKYFCYVGEMSGDTGTKSFEQLLESTFTCLEDVALPNWGDTAYSLTVWERNSSGKSNVNESKHPKRCSVCGNLFAKMYRCRLTYTVIFCSDICAASEKGREMHFDELAYKFLLLPPSLQPCLTEDSSTSAASVKDEQKCVELVGTKESKSKRKRRRKELRKASVMSACCDSDEEVEVDTLRRKKSDNGIENSDTSTVTEPATSSQTARYQVDSSQSVSSLFPIHSQYFASIFSKSVKPSSEAVNSYKSHDTLVD